MVIGVCVDFREPYHFLGVYSLTVNHSRNFPVTSAGIKTDAASFQMAAHRLRVVLCFGDFLSKKHLEGLFENPGEVMEVKILFSAVAKSNLTKVVEDFFIVTVYFIAAFHPQQGFYQTADIIPVCFLKLRCTMDEGVTGGHFIACAFHGNTDRFFCCLQECFIIKMHRDKIRIENGGMPHFNGNAIDL